MNTKKRSIFPLLLPVMLIGLLPAVASGSGITITQTAGWDQNFTGNTIEQSLNCFSNPDPHGAC